MAPNTLARARIGSGWSHPAWYTGAFAPAFCFADGADPAAEPADDPGAVPNPADDWTPPSREEWEEHQQKLAAASAEARDRRKYLKAHGIDPKTGQKTQTDPEPAPADDPAAKGDAATAGASPAEMRQAVERAVAEARIEGMRGAKKLVASFNKALADAGWNGQRLELIMPLVDFDEVDLDDQDDLRERIEQVKKVFPEGFKRTRNPAATANSTASSGQNGAVGAKVDAADKPAPKPEPKSWAEKVAARVQRGE